MKLNRPYIRASVMSMSIIVGATFTGAFRIVVPGSISTSSALNQLPDLPLLALNVLWVISGLVALAGLLTNKRNIEGSGLILVATSYLAFFVAIIGFKTETAGAAAYVLFFAIGAGLRAHYVLDDNNIIIVTTRKELQESVRSDR